MPAPNSRPHLPAAAKTTARISALIQLFFGGSLAAVVLLLGVLLWRLGQTPPSSERAVEAPEPVATAPSSPQESVVDIEPLTDDAPVVPKPPVVVPQTVSKAPAVDPPLAPAPLTVDQIVEQRLQASEDDLRRQLSAVPELHLVKDEEVRKLRAREEVARITARAIAKSIPVQVPRPLVQIPSPTVPVFGRFGARLEMEEEQERINEAAKAEQSRLLAAAVTDIENQTALEFNAKVQQTMRQAALQAGLTLRSGPQCELPAFTAVDLAELSKDLRGMGFVSFPALFASNSIGGGDDALAALLKGEIKTQQQEKIKRLQAWCDQRRVEVRSGAVPALTQILQIEDEPTRLLLVRELSRIKHPHAAIELADRALMDLSPTVRRAAIAALERRSWSVYGPVLLRGLRYPWPPVADHAAVALRTLQQQEAAAPLIDLLDLPSPTQPFLDARTNQYSVREMVRLNHLRNCLLCHSPSANANDGLVRGLIPIPGAPLPTLPSVYYGKFVPGSGGDFVRADITFLRQDFSVNLPVSRAAPWPDEQRFDFVTRRRLLHSDEMSEIADSSDTYPQRQAVLYALHGLTGKDGGNSPTKWRELLGIALDKKASH